MNHKHYPLRDLGGQHATKRHDLAHQAQRVVRTLLTTAFALTLCTTDLCAVPMHSDPATIGRRASHRAARHRAILQVSPITVQCAEGSAPQLPWQVWVTYTDGTHEWRQTRWMNTSTNHERSLADPKQHPVGSTYSVEGFVVGDATTSMGFPIKAEVTVVAAVDAPGPTSSRPIAQPLPLCDIRLTGTNRLTQNRQLDIDNLLSIDPRQMLYNYRDTYGLPTDGYPVADGWDSPTTKLKGHGTGHYLSALAFAYATEQDDSLAQRLLSIIRLMVDEMRACQERTFVYDDSLGRYREARDYAPADTLRHMLGTWQAMDSYKQDYRHYGYGYLNAIPAAHPVLIEMYRAYNNEQWVWAPYYTIHKQLAGLIDIAQQVDDPAISRKALLIAKDMGLWVWNRMHYRTYVKSDGTRAERQAEPGNRYEMWNMYIAGEVGGMQESLARLSQMVGDQRERECLLEAARAFDAPAFFDPLSHNVDDVRTRHANQHIPMVTGALRTYMASGEARYYNVASNFWNLVMGRYAYATGGVGNGEMFRQPYTQMLSMNTNSYNDAQGIVHPNPTLNETCCAYNLAKLTRDFNMYAPDDARLMDYYERVMMNQIVGSLHPDHFACTYQYAVGLNAAKPFGNETPQSTCCGGTGAENHVKYPEAAYFASDSTLWVTQYMPTEALWRHQSISIQQHCQWPAEHVTLRFTPAASAHRPDSLAHRFALKLRIPYWATSDGRSVQLNGRTIASAEQLQPCSYYEIPVRDWAEGDSVTIHLPYTVHLAYGPDRMERAAIDGNAAAEFQPAWLAAVMAGPLVLATQDVRTWDEADVRLSADLSNIVRQKVSGSTKDSRQKVSAPSNNRSPKASGPTYVLRDGSKRSITLTPDYAQTEASTRYMRVHVMDNVQTNTTEQLRIDRQLLRAALTTADERHQAQQAWDAMATKVPWHAPWAPNGYQRMLLAAASARLVSDNPDSDAEAVSSALSSLNASINAMRPGNLAEPEDLAELLSLLSAARTSLSSLSVQDARHASLSSAIAYAEMVIRYVNDGSGTLDLIRKAVQRLSDGGE